MERQFDPPTQGVHGPARKNNLNGLWVFVGLGLLTLVLIFQFGRRMGAMEAETLLNKTRKEIVEQKHKSEEEKKPSLNKCGYVMTALLRRIGKMQIGLLRSSENRKGGQQEPLRAPRTRNTQCS